jgi:hypothetical protein
VAAPAPSSRPSAPPPARATPSGPPTTTESAPAAAPTAPHSRSATRSSSPSGTCCRRARSTSTPAATTTLGATRPHHPTARRQARTPRLFSHAARSAGGDLNQNFSSQKTSGNASFRPSGGSPVRIRLSLRCRPPSPPSRRSHFTLAAAPVAWRAIEPEGSRGSLQRARVAQAERLDHGSTGNGCGLVPRHWITDSRCPRWSPVMGSSENAPKKVVVSSRRAA